MTDEHLRRDEQIALHVAQLIADWREGGAVEVVGFPERDDRTNPAVEVVTRDSVGRLAIEHTRIESFTGQIDDDRQIKPYAEELPRMLDGDLPTMSRFDLNLRVRSVVGVKRTAEAIEAIAAWARGVGPQLPDGRPGVRGEHIARGGPPTLPFEVSLARWPRDAQSPIPHVTVGWWAPEDLESRRDARIATALAKKFPKINAATVDPECEGVLVLESEDIHLANAVDIQLALQRSAEAQREPIPAWLVLWETVGDTAFVSVLRAAGAWNRDPKPVAASFPVR